MKNFTYWKAAYDDGKLIIFGNDKQGLLWLKIKSITRANIISDFANSVAIQLVSTTLQEQFEELFKKLSENIESSHESIDKFLYNENKKQLATLDSQMLVSELYKLKAFDWGIEDLKTSFAYKGRSNPFEVLADIIFIIK